MTSFNAYLMFDGTAAQAMPFYRSILGGKLDVMTFGQAPDMETDKMSPATAARVMHAMLSFEGGQLMASDTMEGQPFEGMKGFSLTINTITAAEAEKFFAALAEGGQVTMPIGPTFWAERFGMCTDRFGTPWMVNGGVQQHV